MEDNYDHSFEFRFRWLSRSFNHANGTCCRRRIQSFSVFVFWKYFFKFQQWHSFFRQVWVIKIEINFTFVKSWFHTNVSSLIVLFVRILFYLTGRLQFSLEVSCTPSCLQTDLTIIERGNLTIIFSLKRIIIRKYFSNLFSLINYTVNNQQSFLCSIYDCLTNVQSLFPYTGKIYLQIFLNAIPFLHIFSLLYANYSFKDSNNSSYDISEAKSQVVSFQIYIIRNEWHRVMRWTVCEDTSLRADLSCLFFAQTICAHHIISNTVQFFLAQIIQLVIQRNL